MHHTTTHPSNTNDQAIDIAYMFVSIGVLTAVPHNYLLSWPTPRRAVACLVHFSMRIIRQSIQQRDTDAAARRGRYMKWRDFVSQQVLQPLHSCSTVSSCIVSDWTLFSLAVLIAFENMQVQRHQQVQKSRLCLLYQTDRTTVQYDTLYCIDAARHILPLTRLFPHILRVHDSV